MNARGSKKDAIFPKFGNGRRARLTARLAVLAILAVVGVVTVPLAAAAATTITVNSTNDPGDGTCDVTECTLREAIIAANSTVDADTINFSIPGLGPHTISPVSQLPSITAPVIIDGTTEPDYAGSPIVELDGTGAGTSSDGLQVVTNSSVIQGLVVNRFGDQGIELRGSDNIVRNNYVGTDVSGTLPRGNGRTEVVGVPSSARGGGIYIAASTPSGTVAARNVIENSVISANVLSGVMIENAGTSSNIVRGNRIGTDATGSTKVGDQVFGVDLRSAGSDNVLGGTSSGSGNVVSGNAIGVRILGGGLLGQRGSFIQGNLIGTDASGTRLIGNVQRGIQIASRNNQIGGTTAAARNVVAGHERGVELTGNTATGNVVQGNFIGTDVTGRKAFTIGGRFTVLGNNIGVDVVGNARNNRIGGAEAGAGNVISANQDGIRIGGSSGNSVLGNFIGTDVAGTVPLGNTVVGVRNSTGSGNVVGGLGAGAANTIAFNGVGVSVPSGTGHGILGNSIFSSTITGIDLGLIGVTPNDPGDADTGANDLQNFPVLASASSSGGSTTVPGTLNSTPNTTFRVELFSNGACGLSGNGEGQTLLGALSVTTDATGDATFSATVTPPAGQSVITSTATDPANNTSEFSNCVAPASGPGPPATLVLSPQTATSTAGTSHTVAAMVKDASGNPVSGVGVLFSVTGANSTTGTQATDASGGASFTYTGTVAGSDTISAFADTNGNGTADTGEPRDTATKTWIPGPAATFTLSPTTATNVVDSEHCVTATVKDAFANPVSGVSVLFSVTGSTITTGSTVTDVNGKAAFCYRGPGLPGGDTIKAFADTDGSGGQNVSEPSDTAFKTWTLPSSSAACLVIGAGGIVAANGDKATFLGIAHVGLKGFEQYQDHGPAKPMKVKSIDVQVIVCSADMKSASIFGQAQVNGAGSFSYRIEVRDLREPGGKTDTYRIRLSNGYDSGDKVLNQGNILIHK